VWYQLESLDSPRERIHTWRDACDPVTTFWILKTFMNRFLAECCGAESVETCGTQTQIIRGLRARRASSAATLLQTWPRRPTNNNSTCVCVLYKTLPP
jgi:hypothetical protein